MKKYRMDLASLPSSHRQLLTSIGYEERIEQSDAALRLNQELFDFITTPHANNILFAEPTPNASATMDERPRETWMPERALTSVEGDNLRSLLRTLARDWSESGILERSTCYQPILCELAACFPQDDGRGAIKVLVPGAGLGRLAYEISQMGFATEGNEFSLFMLLTSEAILTRNLPRNALRFHPHILPFSNVQSRECAMQLVRAPDVEICPAPASFSMVAGDFLQVYGDETQFGSWDVIVSCFFIDTAKNIIEYIQLFRRLLKPGGRWINLGPLLYHFEGHQEECSIELSMEEIRLLVDKCEFAIQRDTLLEDTQYAQSPDSMHQTIYKSWYFSAIAT